MNKLIAAITSILFLPVSVLATTFYLDAFQGNDNFPGTATQPWQTLAKAKSVVVSGDSVVLANGNYGTYTENLSTNTRTNWVTYIAGQAQTMVFFDRIKVDGMEVNAYLHFESIDILYPPQTTCPTPGAAIDITSFTGVSYVILKNCKIHAVNTYDSGGGVRFNRGLNSVSAVHDLTVDGCEIFQTTTGVRFSGSKTTIINSHIHHIHGTMIGNLCGPMSATDFNAASNVLIENNHLHDMHFFTTEPCYNTPGWSTAHASLIGIRGHDWIIRGNHLHDTWSPVIQLYGNDCGGVYDRGNILFENNIIYDNQAYSLFYNPGLDSAAYIGDPIIFRHNTILSGRQDSTWTYGDNPSARFSADGHVQSVSLNLFPSPPNKYDGAGTLFENNIFIIQTRLGSFNYQNFDDPSAKWIARNNLIYVKGWNSGTLDASNIIVANSINSGILLDDYIDNELFIAPDFDMGHTRTHLIGSDFDLSPKPGSIICNMSTTGGYIGAIPCAIVSHSETFPIASPMSVYPNPATNQLNIVLSSTMEFSFEVRNILGEMVLREKNQSSIDVSHLPVGVYLLMVKQGGKIYTQKIAKVS